MRVGDPDKELGIQVSLLTGPQDSRLIGECAHVRWTLDGHKLKPAEL